MSTHPDENEVDVEPGDVTQNPTKPHEDGAEPSTDSDENPAVAAEDVEDDGRPLDADEGDPSTNDYPAESS